MARIQESAADEGVVDTGVRQAPTTLASSYGGKSQMLNLADIDKVYQQIVGQGTMGQWTGKGWGSADANAKAMAQNLVASGITDIKQVGQSTVTDPGYTKQREDGSYEEVAPATRTVIINKDTGKPLLSDYAERTYGNAWSGTFTGGGNTAYRVQMDAQGNPIFYTTAASSSNADAIMPVIAIAMMAFPGVGTMIGGQLLGAIGVTATPAITAALGNAIMQTVLSGGDIKKGVTAAAASYLGAQAGAAAGEAFAGTELQGFAKNLATNVTRAAVTGTDIGSAALGSAAQSATDYLTKNIPGFKDLSPAVKNTINQSISMSLQSANIDPAKMLETAMLNGATAYGLSQITGFDKLDPKQQGVISSFLQTAIRGGDLSALAMRTAIGLANQEVSRQVAGENKAVAKPSSTVGDFEDTEITRLKGLGYSNEEIRSYLDNLTNLTEHLDTTNNGVSAADTVTGGADTVTGGADTVTGVAGADTAALPANQVAALTGGAGTDTVTGGAGTDVVDSLIDAGLVDDESTDTQLTAKEVRDRALGLTVDDEFGGGTDESVSGTYTGTDTLTGGSGTDTVTGGADSTRYGLVWDAGAGTEGAGDWVQVDVDAYLKDHPDLRYDEVTGEFTPIDSGADTTTGSTTDDGCGTGWHADPDTGICVLDDDSGIDTTTGGTDDTVTVTGQHTGEWFDPDTNTWTSIAATQAANPGWTYSITDGWTKPTTKIEEVTKTDCLPGKIRDASGECVWDTNCDTGYHWDDTLLTCVQNVDVALVCPAGEHEEAGICVKDTAKPIVCDPGYKLNAAGDACVLEEVAVKECALGEERNAEGKCVPIDCGTGRHWDTDLNICVDDTKAALVCPAGEHEEAGICVKDTVTPPVCAEGFELNDAKDACIPVVTVVDKKCNAGFVFDEAEQKCVPIDCGTGYHWDPELNQCMEDTVTCGAGYHWDSELNQCMEDTVQCSAGYHWDPELKQCMQDTPAACPTGYTRNSEGVCVLNTPTTCPTGFHKDSTGNCVADTKTRTTTTLPTITGGTTTTTETPFYAGAMDEFDLFATMDELLHPKAQQNPQEDTKMADGGYLDHMLAEPMSVDDLLKLLR
jgi:hypothetical protein